MAETTEYVHHVIGAVHEIVITDDSKTAVRRALQHEFEECHAGKIVIDLTQINPNPDLLAFIEASADHERSTVRLTHSEIPRPLDSLLEAS